MNDAKTSLIGKIDNLAYHGIHYYGKKQRTGSSFFSGCLWAYLDFAYVIADDGSVQDSLDNLSEMAMETSEDVMFDKGYNRAAKRIAEIVTRYVDSYTEACECPIRHVLSTIYVEQFDM